MVRSGNKRHRGGALTEKDNKLLSYDVLCRMAKIFQSEGKFFYYEPQQVDETLRNEEQKRQ